MILCSLKGKLNQYIIQVGDRRVTLMPLLLESIPKKVEVNFLLQSICEFTDTVNQEGVDLL